MTERPIFLEALKKSELTDPAAFKFGGWKTRRGHVKLHELGRGLACLIGAIFVAETSFVDRNSTREDNRMRIVEGEDGVGTMSLAISPKGSLIATTDSVGRVSLRDEKLGWQIGKFAAYQGCARSVGFAPDGRFLAIGGTNFGIALWDRERDNIEQSEVLALQDVRAMAISPDGRYLAAASNASSQVVVWDWNERSEKTILTSRSPVLSLAFSPNGRYLASGEKGNRPSIQVWDLETGRARLVLDGSLGHVVAVAFSPDGAMLATAAAFENVVRLWDMTSGHLRRMIAGHPFGTNSVAFSPDGRALASAGNDGMVRLWSVATGELRAALDGRTNRLNRVAFSPDGQIIVATGSGDNHLRFWELTDVIPCRIDSLGCGTPRNRNTNYTTVLPAVITIAPLASASPS
jgi:WD40 repeat protein